jgi:hypothetical protein
VGWKKFIVFLLKEKVRSDISNKKEREVPVAENGNISCLLFRAMLKTIQFPIIFQKQIDI